MSLGPRLDRKPLQLEKAEHDNPGEDNKARETGGRVADLGPSCAPPDAHKQHQIPREVYSEHQHRKPGRRPAGKEHQSEQ
jgi:hypothetical protein